MHPDIIESQTRWKMLEVWLLEKMCCILFKRSGEEGIYPRLIKFCENHLEKLDPKSRALRKETPVATAASLSEEEWSQIANDLMVWCTVVYCVFICLLFSCKSFVFQLCDTAASLRSKGFFELCSLQTWEDETKQTETSLKAQSVFDIMKDKMPPIRGSSCFVPLNEVISFYII